MNLYAILILVSIYICFFVVGTTLFISLFHTRLFKRITVFFYRGIILLITTCILIFIILLLIKSMRYVDFYTYRDIFLIITILFSFNIIFFTHIPITANRSVSIFILGYMNKNGNKTYTKKEIAHVLQTIYLERHNEVQRRFNEQIVSGNIVQKKGAYTITKQGKLLIKAYTIIADAFMIDKTNLSS